MEYRYHLGIDPDTQKSGVALWDKWSQKFVFISNMEFWSLIEFIKTGHFPKLGGIEGWSQISFIIIIDAGWLIPVTNFHSKIKDPKIREKVSMNTGRNHEVGILMSEYCQRNGLNYSLHEPSGKLSQITFRNITRWQPPTNQDNRDAAMLVFKK